MCCFEGDSVSFLSISYVLFLAIKHGTKQAINICQIWTKLSFHMWKSFNLSAFLTFFSFFFFFFLKWGWSIYCRIIWKIHLEKHEMN